MARNLRVRTNPTASLFSGLVGIVFVIIGVTQVVPHGGAFGVVWTLLAAGFTIMHLYNAFSSDGIAKEIIEVDDDGSATGADPETRLRKLEDLRAKALITSAEYEQRRREILDQV